MDVTRVMGYADGCAYPWDFDEDYAEELHEELKAQMARKRPPGFTARWDEP